MRNIARAAGVHQTTVSLALRNRPSLPETTRLRIQKIADEMGYRPDPVLSALNVYRNPSPSGEVALKRFSMVYLTEGKSPDAWREHAGQVRYRVGAMRRAEELGYHLEDFWLDRQRMPTHRLTQILKTRNVNGVIVAPLMQGEALDLEWEHFAWVSITSSLYSPGLNTIRNDHLASVRLAYRNLQKAGYQRIGLAMGAHSDSRVQCMWSTGVWGEEGLLPQVRRVPVFRPERWDDEAFGKWLRKTKPDVVLSITPHLEAILSWLKHAGWRVPEDLGVACLGSRGDGGGDVSGIVQSPELIGKAAVEVMAGLIQRNDIGLPENPQTTLISSTWREGLTTRHAIPLLGKTARSV